MFRVFQNSKNQDFDAILTVFAFRLRFEGFTYACPRYKSEIVTWNITKFGVHMYPN